MLHRQVAPLRLRPGDVADYQRYFLRERAARGGASKRPKLSPEVRCLSSSCATAALIRLS